jgi:hypothetical protein
METATEIRSVPRRIEWRNYWHPARLSLQLDRGLPFNVKGRNGPSAVHCDRRIFNQAPASDADERPDFAFSARCRSNRHPRDNRRNLERWRKSLRDVPRHFRCREGGSSRISSVVELLQLRRRQARGLLERMKASFALPHFARLFFVDLEQVSLLGGKVAIQDVEIGFVVELDRSVIEIS